MIGRWLSSLREWWGLVRLSARLLSGRRWWIVPFLPLGWLGLQALILIMPSNDNSGFRPESAQNTLLGMPLAVLGLALGVRVIAGELERRSLEIAYTVPGVHRVWLAKLGAAWLILVLSLAVAAPVVYLFFTPYPASALYGALQGGTAYLVLAMGLAALVRSEVAGALLTAVLLTFNLILGLGLGRFSPLWNPLANKPDDAEQLFAWALQNRVGWMLAIAGLIALAFSRAARRERMLG